MKKQQAIQLFGGVVATAQAVGVTQPAVSRWSATLAPRIVDRIIAALVRAGRMREAAELGKRQKKVARHES